MKVKILAITTAVIIALGALAGGLESINRDFLNRLADNASLPKSESEVKANEDAKAIMPTSNAHKTTYQSEAADKRAEALQDNGSFVSKTAAASAKGVEFRDLNALQIEQTDMSAMANELQANADKGNAEMTAAQQREGAKEQREAGFTGENLSGVMVPLFIAEEVKKDADKNIEGMNISTKTGIANGSIDYNNFSVFGGREEHCYEPHYDYTSLRNECGMTARVTMKYSCADNNRKYTDYNSCKNACGKVCSQYRDYSDPKLYILGQDVTNALDVSESSKNLAKGKAFNSCSGEIRKETDDPCVWSFLGRCRKRVTKGWRHYSCCYDSPTAKELSRVIKEQLSIPTNSCAGIPFAQLERVNWEAPAIKGVMEAQVGNIMDENMRRDLAEKAQKAAADTNEKAQTKIPRL